MGFWGWLKGNNAIKRNNIKIARIKKEISFMTRNQKLDKLRDLKKNEYYTDGDFSSIEDIHDYPTDLNSDFIFCTEGFNLRNNELSAVIGLEQIKRLDNNIKKRKIIDKFSSFSRLKKIKLTFSSSIHLHNIFNRHYKRSCRHYFLTANIFLYIIFISKPSKTMIPFICS